jgi:hypothetical protein
LAPQYSSPVQVTPPLPLEHWYTPPQPSGMEPHLPAHTVAAGVGWQTGSRPQMLASFKPHCWSCAQPPQSIRFPQLSGCWPHDLPLALPGQASVCVLGTHATLPHWFATPPPPQLSPFTVSQVWPPLLLEQS